ncbi:hypothetical protein TBS_16770 [Thermobispora bispora]
MIPRFPPGDPLQSRLSGRTSPSPRRWRRCGLTTPAFPGLPPGETAICHVTGYGLDPDALVRYPVLRCVNEARP